MIWLNGIVRPAEGAFSADDRGLLLGEAVFETILLKHGIAQFWPAHMARLSAACRAFGLPQAYDDRQLKQAVLALLDANRAAPRQIIRITVTGGAGGRGLVPPQEPPPNWLVQLSPAAEPPQALRLHLSTIEKTPNSPTNGHKTTGYLDNIMARRQALEAGADEAIMRNPQGRLCGTAAGTLFVQSGKHLITPPVSEGALPGIVRGALLQQKRCAGLELSEGLVDFDLLHRADALFVSNSVMEVVPACMAESGAVEAGQKKQGHALCEALPQFSDF